MLNDQLKRLLLKTIPAGIPAPTAEDIGDPNHTTLGEFLVDCATHNV